MPRKYASPLHRVLANSVVSRELFYDGTPCLIWTAQTIRNRDGLQYGRLAIRVDGKITKILAHRFVVQFIKRIRLSRGAVVRHLCNNTLCVNPHHLRGGTQGENVQQCIREGWHANAHYRSTAMVPA